MAVISSQTQTLGLSSLKGCIPPGNFCNIHKGLTQPGRHMANGNKYCYPVNCDALVVEHSGSSSHEIMAYYDSRNKTH